MVGLRRPLLLPSDRCASCAGDRTPGERHRCVLCSAALCSSCSVVAPHAVHRRVCAGDCLVASAALRYPEGAHWRVAVHYAPTTPFRGRHEPFLERFGVVMCFASPASADAHWRWLDGRLHAPSISYSVAGPFAGAPFFSEV